MNELATETFRAVMLMDPPVAATPFEHASQEFLFGEVWSRPGLSVRDRRLVTLSCVGGADAVPPIEAHVYAALASGDITPLEMSEVVLHFAVYCGWPKGSALEGAMKMQWARIQAERGETPTAWEALDNSTLGPSDIETRLAGGEACFAEINFVPAPARDSPYFQAGIINFVFGHLWQRPNLSRRDRRLVTLPCVGLSDSIYPIHSHISSALQSGDISYAEMQEIILHFAAYYGFAKGQIMNEVAAEEWERVQPLMDPAVRRG
jgi:4-carboxymuconolactone decarboxylase